MNEQKVVLNDIWGMEDGGKEEREKGGGDLKHVRMMHHRLDKATIF